MGRNKNKKRSHSSSSSSSSSSCDRKRYRSKLKKKERRIDALEDIIKVLRNSYHTGNENNEQGTESVSSVPTAVPGPSSGGNASLPIVRYVGRNDFIPDFDPQTTNVPVEHWIRNLESTARMHGWDERTLICNCTCKLSGYAKGWYERQASFEMSWDEWKDKIIKAFPFTKNKLSQIRELVNRMRLPNEDPIEFYYNKLGIGMSCQMCDEVITEAIIGTLGNQLLEVGAKSAGCHNTTTLLKYLASVSTSNFGVNKYQASTSERKPNNTPLKCFNCGKPGHKASRCHQNKENMKAGINKQNNKCAFCGRLGHTEMDCFRKKNMNKHCSFCNMKGHTLEECRKSKSSPQNKVVRKVQTVCCDFSDRKYFKTVLLNDTPAEAFLDFGSSCNTIKQSYCQKQNLAFTANDEIVIKGYGDALTLPIGIVTAKLMVDGIDMTTNFYVVPDNVQEFDVLVGQPFTEAADVVVIKTASQLSFFKREMALELAELCEDTGKVQLHPQEDVTLEPGINKVFVWTTPAVNATLKVNQSEQRQPMYEKDVVCEEVESDNGSAILKIINRTNAPIKIKCEECIARAELVETPECSEAMPNIGEQLTDKQRKEVISLLRDYDDCFSGSAMALGNCDIEMVIKLREDKIVNYKPYRMSYHEREVVRNVVSELLEAGIVEKSTSPYASPVLLVKRKDGGYRMCVDYRALNKITEKERYPLPVIQDLLDRLVDKTVFCCLDLANGYHQIRIAKESRPYTGFITPDGHFQYRMMSFGLCNAPAVFQRAMNEILAPVIHDCAEAYIDDVILWGDDFKSCLDNLRKVLELIKAAGVKLKRSKCTFLTEKVEYLGYDISKGELRPSPHKIAAVKDFKTPENVHELRQFLGLASYFRKFIGGFATIAKPLTTLTKKDVEWCWGSDQAQSMDKLKEILTTDPVLAIYSPNRETQIHTDASKLGLGGVLLQRQDNGEWKAVAYASRQTTAAETNYHSFELEALAVVFSIMKFKVYVTGLKFVVVTDCSALRLAWSKRDLSPRIARWWLDLQEYNFEVEHRPGTSMVHVDALSRNPVLCEIRQIEEKDLVTTLQAGDEAIQSLSLNLKLELEANKHKKNGLHKDFRIVDGILYRIVNGNNKPVLPKGARWHIMKIYHDDHGHLGLEKCLEAIQAKYWFPKMRKSVEKYISSCIGCQFAKKPTGKQPGLMHPIPKGTLPFHTLHVDHLGPFCKSNGKSYIFAIIDGFTKFVWLESVTSANTKGAITALNKLCHIFGFPARIVSDRGTAFTSKEFQNYCNDHGIKHVLNAVATPRANGQVERLNRTVLNSLTAHMGEERKGWDAYLPKVQLGINSTTSQGTGKSPMELLCGLRPRLAGELDVAVHDSNLSEIRDDASKTIEDNANKMKTRFDKGRRVTKPIPVGKMVMVERKIMRPGLMSGKLVPRYAGPYKVTAVLPNDRYEVTSVTKGKRMYKNTIARDKLKVWKPREGSSSSEEDLTEQ